MAYNCCQDIKAVRWSTDDLSVSREAAGTTSSVLWSLWARGLGSMGSHSLGWHHPCLVAQGLPGGFLVGSVVGPGRRFL